MHPCPWLYTRLESNRRAQSPACNADTIRRFPAWLAEKSSCKKLKYFKTVRTGSLDHICLVSLLFNIGIVETLNLLDVFAEWFSGYFVLFLQLGPFNAKLFQKHINLHKYKWVSKIKSRHFIRHQTSITLH